MRIVSATIEFEIWPLDSLQVKQMQALADAFYEQAEVELVLHRRGAPDLLYGEMAITRIETEADTGSGLTRRVLLRGTV